MSRRLEVLTPLFFWAILLSIALIRMVPFLEGEALHRYFVTLAFTFPLDIGAFSIFYFWLIPKFIKEKQSAQPLIIGITFLFFYSFIWCAVYWLAGRIDTKEGFIAIYQSSLGHTLLHALYAIVLRLSVDWFEKYKRQKELEKQNAVIELALLRSQINPHFLFNVLNNIHSTVYDDPDKTSFSLIKLSEIMRYMLYETNTQRVFLYKEIEYIENYLSLQKLRLQNANNVSFKVSGVSASKQIAPMVFIPFIENTFKHGKKNIENGINISIEVDENSLLFRCSNYKRKLNESEKISTGSVGLENIKRRLELLYPEKHKLTIINNEEKFDVNLMIQLD